MPLNIDWSPTNRSINQLLRYFQQKQLSEQTHKQALFRESERQAGYEALDVAETERARETARIKHGYNLEIANKSMERIIQEQPELDYAIGRKNRLLEAGDDEGAMELTRSIFPQVVGAAQTVSKQLGITEVTPEQMAGAYMMLGTKEAGRIATKSAETRVGEARIAETAAERQRKEAVSLAEPQEDYHKYVVGVKDDANSFLENMLTNYDDYITEEGEPINDSARAAFEAVGKESISKRDLRFLITRNNRMADKSRTGKLSEQEMNQLLTIQNIEESALELTGRPGGEVGQIIGRPEAEAPVSAGELTPEQAVPVLTGMILEKAKAKGAEMTLEEATAIARRQLGIR